MLGKAEKKQAAPGKIVLPDTLTKREKKQIRAVL